MFKKILDFYISTQALLVVLVILTGAVITVLLLPQEKKQTSINVRNIPEQSSIANIQADRVVGDLNNDNELSLLDYTIFLECLGNSSCSQKQDADINLDGRVDELDLNLFYSSLAKRKGD